MPSASRRELWPCSLLRSHVDVGASGAKKRNTVPHSPAKPGDVEQPAERGVSEAAAACERDACSEIGKMQLLIKRGNAERHDQSGDHDERQPPERERDRECPT